jgi:hypothetical protein
LGRPYFRLNRLRRLLHALSSSDIVVIGTGIIITIRIIINIITMREIYGRLLSRLFLVVSGIGERRGGRARRLNLGIV